MWLDYLNVTCSNNYNSLRDLANLKQNFPINDNKNIYVISPFKIKILTKSNAFLKLLKFPPVFPVPDV
jgi:hypothetical protein